MKPELLQRYAQVLLKAGINLQKGQCLMVQGESYFREFLTLVVEEAYRLGAKLVAVDIQDPEWTLARSRHSAPEHLSYVAPGRVAAYRTMVDEEWARIRLDAEAHPGLLAQAPSGALAEINRSQRKALKFYSEAAGAHLISWLVAGLPSSAWAKKIFGDTPDALEKLEGAFARILRLDTPDPIAAWWNHDAQLKKRCHFLEESAFESLHFSGPGTDLTVGLIPKSLWEGGSSNNAKGIPFIANLPTEEVFTTPDFRKTRGRFQSTRPFLVNEVPVKGSWFEFEEGRVVRFGAEEGLQTLEELFASDEQNRSLGEVALVDCSSPIFREGVLFNNVLFDENASCHVALGSGYSSAIPGGVKMSKEELLKAGCNYALDHNDVMLGSEALDVTGMRQGKEVALIRTGYWVI